MTNYSVFSEQQTRDVVAAGIFDHADLVALGRFYPGREGEYPSVAVICQHSDGTPQGRTYSVHTAVVKLSADVEVEVRLIDGEYDLDLDTAKARLDER